MSIWWSLNDEYQNLERNLTTNDGVVVARSSPKVSMLTIEAVKARHRGNYTCFAKNKAGVSQHSAYLAINGLKKVHYFLRSSFFNNFAICFFKIKKY
jgi:Immunoglobulin I-set domain